MIKIFEYENSPIQFEVIDGQVMANATAMFFRFKVFKKGTGHFEFKNVED